MALYDGFPSIELKGDQQRALALIPRAKDLLYRVQEVKRNAAVPVYAMTQRIDDDSSIYAMSAQTVNLIRISVAVEAEEPLSPENGFAESPLEFDPAAPTAPMDMLSGMVLPGTLERGTAALNRLHNYVPTSASQRQHGLPAGRQAVRRLAVEPHLSMPELDNDMPGPTYSQYFRLRPSMYSGKMQKVVQVLMGYGRLSGETLNGLEAAGVSEAYIRDLRKNGVQIRYRYHFECTHGITVAADNRLWLVEISLTRGIVAMPLPIVPGSDTPEFRRRFEDSGDTDIVAVIDELGCLPTGETFPARMQDLEPLLASGEVLRLAHPADLSGFYKAQGYSQALGWAFAPNGAEAHNTGFYYDDVGYQRGLWWEIRISIGSSLPGWRPNAGFGPRASASATPRLREDGYLFSLRRAPATSLRYAIPFKTHVVGLGLVSHIAHPLDDLPAVDCDTVVFVAYINGDLHTVRFYLNSNSELLSASEENLPSDGCYFDGEWYTITRSGGRAYPPMMYSNHEDPRQIAQDYVYTHTMRSTPLGPLPGRFGDMVPYYNYCFIQRHHLFRFDQEQTVVSGEQYLSAVSVPEFVREGYYMTYGEFATTESRSVSVTYNTLADPNGGIGWRCFIGGMYGLPDHPDADPRTCGGDCGVRRIHRERRVVKITRNDPVGCTQFADSGPWLGICDSVEHFNNVPQNIPPSTYNTFPATTRSSGWIKLFMTGTDGPMTEPATFNTAIAWVSMSPDPQTGEYQQIAAYHNAFGEPAVVYYTDYSAPRGGQRRSPGLFIDPLTERDFVPTFVGVYVP